MRGTVACKEKCGASVSVTLVSLAGKRNEERRTVSLTDKSSEFLFQNVIPGKYRFEVHFLSSAHNIVFNLYFCAADSCYEMSKKVCMSELALTCYKCH